METITIKDKNREVIYFLNQVTHIEYIELSKKLVIYQRDDIVHIWECSPQKYLSLKEVISGNKHE